MGRIFQDLQVNFDKSVCNTIRGRKLANGIKVRSQPVVIIFQRQLDKGLVCRNLRNLKGKEA